MPLKVQLLVLLACLLTVPAFASDGALLNERSKMQLLVGKKTKGKKAVSGNPSLKKFSGYVSWYGVPFHGRKTASGVIFDMNKLSCAHKTLPFFTRVLVEDPRTGKTVIVSVLDRGPYVGTRVMDLSRQAARDLGTLLGGVAWVDCIVVDDTACDASQ